MNAWFQHLICDEFKTCYVVLYCFKVFVRSHVLFKLIWFVLPKRFNTWNVGACILERLDMDSRITEPDPRCEEQVQQRHGSHYQRPGAEVQGHADGKLSDSSTPGGGAWEGTPARAGLQESPDLSDSAAHGGTEAASAGTPGSGGGEEPSAAVWSGRGSAEESPAARGGLAVQGSGSATGTGGEADGEAGSFLQHPVATRTSSGDGEEPAAEGG